MMSKAGKKAAPLRPWMLSVALGAALCTMAGTGLARSPVVPVGAEVLAMQADATAPGTGGLTVAQAAPKAGAGTAQRAGAPIQGATGSSAFEQVPGVFRQQVGTLQVTALLDGFLPIPHAMVQGIRPARAQAMLKRGFVPEEGDSIRTAVNTFLVRRGDRLMLFDTGARDCLAPTAGVLPQSLRAAGVNPDAITDVLLTHAHPDHVCGLVDKDGHRVFVNARVWVSATEADFWMNAAQKAKAPQDAQPFFDNARIALETYQSAGRLERFGERDALPPGVKALKTPGHTIGHVSWLIDGAVASGSTQDGAGQDAARADDSAADAGKRRAGPATPAQKAQLRDLDAARDQLLVWGDIVHFHAIQFEQPGVWAGFDATPKVAVQSRRTIMARAAQQGWWVAGAHLPFPGIGHVLPARKAYRWAPAEFGPVSARP